MHVVRRSRERSGGEVADLDPTGVAAARHRPLEVRDVVLQVDPRVSEPSSTGGPLDPVEPGFGVVRPCRRLDGMHDARGRGRDEPLHPQVDGARQRIARRVQLEVFELGGQQPLLAAGPGDQRLA